MRVRFLFPAIFRIGDPVVAVSSTEEIHEVSPVAQDDFLARYVEGTHYEVVHEETEAEREARFAAEAAAREAEEKRLADEAEAKRKADEEAAAAASAPSKSKGNK